MNYEEGGDGFPWLALSNTSWWWLVDIVGQVETATPAAVAPSTVTFTNGVWSGDVSVLAAAANVHLHVDDGAGHVGNTNEFDVLALPPLMATVPAEATEGDGTVMATITIPAALDQDLTVNISSSDTGRASVPDSLVIPAGETSLPLPIEIIDNLLLDGPEAVTITATAPGYLHSTGTIEIHDNETATLTLTLPPKAREGDGVLPGAGLITASAAPTRDMVIYLLSSYTDEVTVPATVILPAGQTTVSFDLQVGYDRLLDGAQTVLVTASMDNWTPGTASIRVAENDALAGDWDTLGNGPSHTGYFPGVLGSDPVATLAWSDNISSNQVAVADGRVYVTESGYFYGGPLVALDENTGAELWQYSLPYSSFGPPTFDSGHVYVQQASYYWYFGNNQLWSIDAATGAATWSTALATTSYYPYLAPAVADGKVWVGTYGGLGGFDQTTGNQLFSSSMPYDSEWTPTYYNGKVYTWVSGVFEEHDPVTGAVNWSVDVASGSYYGSTNTVPAIDNNRAFMIGTTGLIAVDLTAQSQLWSVPDWGFTGSPAVVGDTVYAIHGTQVRAYDVATGTLEGTFETGQTLMGQPIVTSDGLLVASSNETFLFSRSDYRLLTTVPEGGQISLADNTLYIASSSTLYAYHLASYLPLTVTVPANATEGDGTVSGSVSIPYALDDDLLVNLTSGDAGRAAVPASVTIPAGQTAVALPIEIIDNLLLDGPEGVTITATAANYTTGSGTLTVHDNETAVLTVTLPASAKETDGILYGAGTITCDRRRRRTSSCNSAPATPAGSPCPPRSSFPPARPR